jgi:hypothetical protein
MHLRMGQRKFEPSEAQRRQVMTMSGFGIQQHEIARMIEVTRRCANTSAASWTPA